MAFLLHEWRNGTISTDNDPNTAAPAESRAVQIGDLPASALHGFKFWALDGTDLSVMPWVHDAARGLWLKLRVSAVVVASASSPVVSVVSGLALPPRSKLFMQVTAIQSVTKFGWHYT